jgi:hypothetical protein
LRNTAKLHLERAAVLLHNAIAVLQASLQLNKPQVLIPIRNTDL